MLMPECCSLHTGPYSQQVPHIRDKKNIMKTLICTEPKQMTYGQKKQPGGTPGHAIIKIKRIGICGTDLHAYEGVQPYFSYPRILGHELSGELVEMNGAP